MKNDRDNQKEFYSIGERMQHVGVIDLLHSLGEILLLLDKQQFCGKFSSRKKQFQEEPAATLI